MNSRSLIQANTYFMGMAEACKGPKILTFAIPSMVVVAIANVSFAVGF